MLRYRIQIITANGTDDDDKKNENANTFIRSTANNENNLVESIGTKRINTFKKGNIESSQISNGVKDKK